VASGVDELGVDADRGKRAGEGTPKDGEARRDGEAAEAAESTGTGSGRGSRVPDAVKRLADRFGIGALEGTALRMWVLTRVSIFIFVYNIAWVTQPRDKYGPHSFTILWERWDWLRYQGIAQHGYDLSQRHGSSIAFFPGYPIMLRAVQTVFRSYVYSGLLISFVTGAIASVTLTRIIAQEAQRAFGTDEPALEKTRTAVREGTLLWLFSPAAFFLAAGYTEAPFLAFALPAWLYARRGRWLASGLLMAGASAIRINGMFELAAVGVLFLTQTKPRSLRELLRGAPLLVALAPVLAYFGYLYHLTGKLNAWHNAEVNGWNRHLTDPVHALTNTWQLAFGGRILRANNAWEYQLEIVAMAAGIALLVWLLRKHRWAEATFVGLSVVTLGTSHNYLSVPRELLLWWPLWAILGVWTVRRPVIRTVYLCVSAPLMFTVAYLYLMGLWSG
jgi:hypothetical protein